MRVTRRSVRTRSGIEALVLALALAGCSTGSDSAGAVETESSSSDLSLRDPFIMPPIRAQVVAQGIPGAGAITEVGTFHRGSPIHDKATLNPSIAPGMVLDPLRLLVASSSSFGATLSRPAEAPGAVLSLDVTHGLVTVAPDLATAGGQAASADGLAQIYANQDAAFLNSVNNPTAATAALPSSSLPLGISINSGNGRPWIANAPTGANGAGTITVDDPSGAPLAGPPNLVAGGVFSGDATNRSSASTEGLDHGAVGHRHPRQVARRDRQGGVPRRRGGRQHRPGPRPQGGRRAGAGRDVSPAHQRDGGRDAVDVAGRRRRGSGWSSTGCRRVSPT